MHRRTPWSFDETAVSERRAFTMRLIDKRLSRCSPPNFAEDHKGGRPGRNCIRRGHRAPVLAACFWQRPVCGRSAMLEIDLPWTLVGHNLRHLVPGGIERRSWCSASAGNSIPGHGAASAQTAQPNMDTLISLGHADGPDLQRPWAIVGPGRAHHLYFESGAVIAALILLGTLLSRPAAGGRASEGPSRKLNRAGREGPLISFETKGSTRFPSTT